MKMRIPTNQEYDKLIDLTNGAAEKMHWWEMYSWVDDTEDELGLPEWARVVRGYHSARHWNNSTATSRHVGVGFRPVIEPMPTDTLPSEGELCVIGTLYMDGKPVKVPKNPVQNGDIVNYIPGTKLEMRKPLDAPDYQVTGFHLGNGVFVADRVLLRYISYADIEETTVDIPKSATEVFVYISEDGLIEVYSTDDSIQVTLIDAERDDPVELAEAEAQKAILDKKVDDGTVTCIYA